MYTSDMHNMVLANLIVLRYTASSCILNLLRDTLYSSTADMSGVPLTRAGVHLSAARPATAGQGNQLLL